VTALRYLLDGSNLVFLCVPLSTHIFSLCPNYGSGVSMIVVAIQFDIAGLFNNSTTYSRIWVFLHESRPTLNQQFRRLKKMTPREFKKLHSRAPDQAAGPAPGPTI
jgi:hypothetical protein